MTISWEIQSLNPLIVIYFVDSVSVGEKDGGFDKVLERVKTSKSRNVTLKIKGAISLGGSSLEDNFPFKERFHEFKAALGTKALLYEIF